VTASYDAAVTTDKNRKYWVHTDSHDAVVSNKASVRKRVRERARYEVANNSYAKGMVETQANDIIGKGPKLQIITGNEELDTDIEAAWSEYAKSIKLASKLRTMLKAKLCDGEAFAQKFTNTAISPVSLDIRLLEGDQISSAYDMNADGFVEGIRFDDNGMPSDYYVLDGHPGGMYAKYGGHTVPAEYMIHWFRTDRAGQVRGISEMMPALQLFVQLRAYTVAVLSAAELAAAFTLMMKTDKSFGELAHDFTGTDSDDPDGDDFNLLEIVHGMMTQLPANWETQQLKAEQPTSTYESFKHELINEAARCMNMPYNIAAGNSSSYNYASGRLDHQTYFKHIEVVQEDCEVVVLDSIFADWLNEWRLVTVPDGLEQRGWRHQWMWEGHEHVDPAKEANAQSTKLGALTASLKREWAKQGLDWETEVRQIAKERGLLNELGISIPSGNKAADVEDDNDDDKE